MNIINAAITRMEEVEIFGGPHCSCRTASSKDTLHFAAFLLRNAGADR